jgi:hypothetical protein
MDCSLFWNQLTVSAAVALSPELSVAVTVYVPAVDGAAMVAVKLPEESVIIVAKVVEPIFMVSVDSGATIAKTYDRAGEETFNSGKNKDYVGNVSWLCLKWTIVTVFFSIGRFGNS